MKSISLNQVSTLLCALIIIASCKVKKPISDKTPPGITQWTLIDQVTQEVLKFPASGGAATVITGREYILTCYAKDAEGLASLNIEAAQFYDCVKNKPSLVVWYSREGITSKPNKNNEVETVLLYGKKFVIKDKYPCNSNFIPFTAIAENYGGLEGKGYIRLNIQ